MANQIIYTSCASSLDNDSGAIQIWSYTPGVSEEAKRIMPSIAAYSLEGTQYKTTLKDKSEAKDYPVAFRYVYKDDKTVYIMSSRYLGVDYSRTRFGGNYISHSIESPVLEYYPIEYYRSSMFHDYTDDLDVTSGNRPQPLPPIKVNRDANRPINFENVIGFINDGHQNDVDRILMALLDGISVVISDSVENIPLWIAASTMVLPLSFAKKISFSTFGDLTQCDGLSITPKYKDSPGLRILTDIPEPDAFIDKYISKMKSEPVMRTEFFMFLKTRRTNIENLQQLKDEFLFYLISTKNPEAALFDTQERSEIMIMNNIDTVGDEVLFNYLKTAAKDYLDEASIRKFVKISGHITDPGKRKELLEIYSAPVLSSLKGCRGVPEIKTHLDTYTTIIKMMLGQELIGSISDANTAYVVMNIWRVYSNQAAARLLGDMELGDQEDVLVEMIISDPVHLPLYAGDQSPLSGTIIEKLNRQQVTDFESLDDEDFLVLLMQTAEKDPYEAGKMFETSTERANYSAIVEEYVSTLDPYGDYSLSDAVNFCLSSPNCPYLSLLMIFDDRYMTVESEEVKALIRTVNDKVNVLNPDMMIRMAASKIASRYPDYDLCIDGDNRISAVTLVTMDEIGREDIPDILNYHPDDEELVLFIRNLIQRKMAGSEWFVRMIKMFDFDHYSRPQIIDAINTTFREHSFGQKHSNRLAEYLVALLRMEVSDQELSSAKAMFKKQEPAAQSTAEALMKNMLQAEPEKMNRFKQKSKLSLF